MKLNGGSADGATLSEAVTREAMQTMEDLLTNTEVFETSIVTDNTGTMVTSSTATGRVSPPYTG